MTNTQPTYDRRKGDRRRGPSKREVTLHFITRAFTWIVGIILFSWVLMLVFAMIGLSVVGYYQTLLVSLLGAVFLNVLKD